MCFVLAVDQRGRMWKDLDQIVIVQLVYLLVVCKGAVQNIHNNASVVHHTESIYRRSDVSLVPPVQDYFDALDSSLHYSYESGMLSIVSLIISRSFFLLPESASKLLKSMPIGLSKGLLT